jgi:biotin carboxyl carrier protein
MRRAGRRGALLFALILGVAAPGVAQQAPMVRGAGPLPAGASALRLEGTPMQGALVRGHARPGTRLTLDGHDVPVAADGTFVLGFDRDAPAAATLVERFAGAAGTPLVVTTALTVAPRAWRIDPVMAQLRPPELAQIAAARAIETDAQGWRQRFVWPAIGRISGWFGSQRVYRGEPGAYHSGTDVALPVGAPVVAPADGVVILAADHPFTLEGNLLMIDHGMGLNSAFLHLSRIAVAVGDHVRQGQVIGAVGKTGRATGPHLHWSLRWRDARLDPMLVAGAMPAK